MKDAMKAIAEVLVSKTAKRYAQAFNNEESNSKDMAELIWMAFNQFGTLAYERQYLGDDKVMEIIDNALAC